MDNLTKDIKKTANERTKANAPPSMREVRDSQPRGHPPETESRQHQYRTTEYQIIKIYKKKSKIMKKFFYSIVLLVTLVIVAGSAKALNDTSVLPGGTYTYNLKGIYSANNATAVVAYSDAAKVTITQLSSSYTILPNTNSTVAFTIKYGTQSDPATSGKITVTITDQTSNCSNSIELNITVLAMPTYTLNLTTNTTGYSECQARTGVGNNLADARGTETNTFKYIVTPDIQNITGKFTYLYKINLPSNTVLSGFNNGGAGVTTYNSTTGVVTHTDVTAVTPDEFTVTFTTTTGKPEQIITATLDAAASNVVPENGGGTYVSSIAAGGSDTKSVTVKAVPTIGKFE